MAKKTASVGIRLDPELKEVAEIAAADDRRTLAALMELALIEYLHKRDYVTASGAVVKGKKK